MSYENESLHVALKSVALQKMVEAGIIPQAEGGSVDTADFERFWTKFAPNVETWAANEVLCRKEKRYYSTDNSAGKRDSGRCESIYDRIPSLAFFCHFLLPFLLGFFGALALVFR